MLAKPLLLQPNSTGSKSSPPVLFRIRAISSDREDVALPVRRTKSARTAPVVSMALLPPAGSQAKVG